jgi:hypothetical protein
MNKTSHIFIVFVLICSSCIGHKKHNKEVLKWDSHKKLEYWVYGLPGPMYRQVAEEVVANKWGFTYKRVAGCMVTQKLQDNVKLHNESVNLALTDKFGKNWEAREAKEEDAEFVTEAKVIALLDKLKKNQVKRNQLEKEGNGLDYDMQPLSNSLQYNVSANGWGTIKGKDAWVSYYRYLVDLQNNTVKQLSDTVKKI